MPNHNAGVHRTQPTLERSATSRKFIVCMAPKCEYIYMELVNCYTRYIASQVPCSWRYFAVSKLNSTTLYWADHAP